MKALHVGLPCCCSLLASRPAQAQPAARPTSRPRTSLTARPRSSAKARAWRRRCSPSRTTKASRCRRSSCATAGAASPSGCGRTRSAFARAGYFVVTFDYRGWGPSEGRIVATKPLGARQARRAVHRRGQGNPRGRRSARPDDRPAQRHPLGPRREAVRHEADRPVGHAATPAATSSMPPRAIRG